MIRGLVLQVRHLTETSGIYITELFMIKDRGVGMKGKSVRSPRMIFFIELGVSPPVPTAGLIVRRHYWNNG